MSGLLPALAVALACGVFAADRAWLGPDSARLLAVVALGPAAIACRGPRARATLAWVAALAAGAIGLGSRLEVAARNRPVEPRRVTVEATVCASPRAFAGRTRVLLCDAWAVDPGEIPVPERILLRDDLGDKAGPWIASLHSGQRLRARLRLRPLRSLGNPGGRVRDRAYARRGLGAGARLADWRLAAVFVDPGGASARGRIDALRQRIGQRLRPLGPGAGLLQALGIGDRGALEARSTRAFAALGVSHLIAVSGLHLGLVAAIAFAALHGIAVRVGPLVARRDPRQPVALAAVAVAGGYALLCGWGLPVQRALTFVAVLVVALTLGRRAARSHLLASAGIVVLVGDPAALFDLGAQLSFAASAALLFAVPAPPLATLRGPRDGAGPDRIAARLQRAVAAGVRTSASAIAVTAPLLAAWGLGAGPLSLLANLVLVPWTALVLLPTALVAAAVAAVAGEGWVGRLLIPAERLARGTLQAIEAAAAALPDLGAPLAPPVWALWVAGLAAGLALRARGTAQRVAIAAGISTLLRLAPPAQVPPAPPRIVSLDVGQGDATLVQGLRASLLVDGGRAVPGRLDLGRRVVVPALRALGVTRLDLVVASHADVDHSGGLVAVLEALPVGALWLPPGGRDDDGFSRLRVVARNRGVRVRERGAGDPAWHAGDLSVTPLWPPRGVGARSLSRNDRSLVVRVSVAGGRLLLPGDLGRAGEARLLAAGADLRAEVLKLGHHGSRGSSSAAFLEAVGAGVVLLSAGCPASRGLPNPVVVRRAWQAGAAIWWTGRDGAVFVSLAAPTSVWSWAPRPDCASRLYVDPV